MNIQNRKRILNTENKLLVARGEGSGGRTGETGEGD